MAKEEIKKIKFFYLDRTFYFPSRTRLKSFLSKLFKAEGISIERVNYIFCSDGYLLELNKTHLNHKTLTDILTFQYSPNGEPVLSDIYISIDRLKENATIYQNSFLDELYRVIFHGALHLSGYKDKSKNDAALMRESEDKYLALYHS